MDAEVETRWFAVRSLFQHAGDPGNSYEERITLWQADTSEEALERGAAEAAEYAEFAAATYLGEFGQIYLLPDAPPRDGAEVFSLVRESPLPPQPYLDRFFDTGTERQQ